MMFSAIGSFRINAITGVITVKRCYNPGTCIDYERQPGKQYRLSVIAADDGGEGYHVRVPVIVNIIDANDNKPIFTQNEYGLSVRENETTFVPPLFVAVRSTSIPYNDNILRNRR